MKLLTKKRYEELRFFEGQYSRISGDLTRVTSDLTDRKKLMSVSAEKLAETGDVICRIGKDRKGNDALIFMRDERICREFYGKIAVPAGDVTFYAMSCICQERGERYITLPYLQGMVIYNEKEENLIFRILNLFGKVDGKQLGYGSLLIEAAESFAKAAGCKKITGMLSFVDAETDSQKDERNRFYEHKGYTVSYQNDEKRDGTFCKNL